nr:MAG TPA: hypothetical protein [Caudoviricetes sp.]
MVSQFWWGRQLGSHITVHIIVSGPPLSLLCVPCAML